MQETIEPEYQLSFHLFLGHHFYCIVTDCLLDKIVNCIEMLCVCV